MNGNGPAVLFTKKTPEAKTPTYAHAEDSAADLYASESATLAPGETVGIKTGIAVAFPFGYAAQIRSKSGLALFGLTVVGGVIDNGYRGEIVVIMHNTSKMNRTFNPGEKVGQLFLEKVEQAHFMEVEQLPDAPRGDAGFGSTGK